MKFEKTLLICSVLLLVFASFRSVHDDGHLKKSMEFKLTVIQNKTSGTTWLSYTISGRKLRIYEKPFGNSGYIEHIFTDHHFKTADFFSKLEQLGLESLDSSYINNCLPSNSRVDLAIVYQRGSNVSKVLVQGYYLEKIQQLLGLINSLMSSAYHIGYLPKETKQDCE